MSQRPKLKVTVPTTIVIFGVTGDLSQRKLIPSLLDLYVKGLLPEIFGIVGFSRRPMTDDQLRQFMRAAIRRSKRTYAKTVIERFLKHASYQQGNFDDSRSYTGLGEALIRLDAAFNICSNKLFYLAVPPKLYDRIFNELAKSGLSIPCIGENEGWTRVLVEKPFGRDLQTAQKLDEKLGRLFQEEQIFRIDHYLAKETIQNILMFRFSNALFEPIWSRQYIEKVEIISHEKLGVEGRGDFYDDIGALRDVGQNHMLQMLAAIAMEHPGQLATDEIRRQRVAVLEALEPITAKTVNRFVVRGQYQGFRAEKEVTNDSQTETYFRLEAHVRNKRWQGVPFILESGKKMQSAVTEIRVYFKQTTSCLCPPGTPHHHQDVLTFRIQPDEGISVLFWAKKPGFTPELEARNLSFYYIDSADAKMIPEAYEQVLFDCIRGDQTRFISTEEVRASWQYITPILKHWSKTKLYSYKPGGVGPVVKK